MLLNSTQYNMEYTDF